MEKNTSLDEVDRKILSILQTDGRITNVKLAASVGLSAPSVLERVRKLEERGLIGSYVALLNREKLGFGLMAFVLVSLASHRLTNIDQFRQEVLHQSEVLECHHVAGEGDFLLKVVARDIGAYRDFLVSSLTSMEGVQRVNTMIVFETLKGETSLPVG